MKKLLMLVLVAIMALGVLTACGGGGGAAPKEITVEMGKDGQWKFSPETIDVAKGDNVKINLVNKDASQAHSFVIANLNVKSQQIAANSTGSVTFKADKTGSFDIICDVPGHKDAGMVAKINVK